MNINEWINSGVIESYVLGELNQEEMREVEEMAQRYPEVQKEIEQTEEALEGIAMKAGLQPRQEVKSKILQQIERELKTDKQGLDQEPSPEKNTSEIQPESFKSMKLWQYWSAAASALLVLATVLAIYYRQQWQVTESELENYLAENQNLTQEYQALRSDYDKLQEQQNILSSPNFTQVKLNGTDVSPSAYAVVYWNAESEEVYLHSTGLPTPESGKQYQLWAIVDGQPQSAGVFDLQNQLVDMQEIQNASAFAITLEPEGGSENPTLEAMYVLGEV
ncbi:anti-sigma-K factor RskA [Catalinimonas alkaloidigena]|uniref:anti-sigma factor n=1 Tax=Catalinimonas alkaloidigena TaxID=1075417 RepID=UPI002404FCF5|nr:anti-sigma factor [Catalinimonas alkaloidigena]MDF9798123.1 anti-sigma-K factor RskA [Catalinimonas alkaloidigena]